MAVFVYRRACLDTAGSSVLCIFLSAWLARGFFAAVMPAALDRREVLPCPLH